MNIKQAAKLRALLEHARGSTVYYAARLSAWPAPFPADIAGVLASLTPLSRQDVRHEKVRLQSTEGDTASWRMTQTTGTTGEPVTVILDERARRAELTVLADHIDRWLDFRYWRERNVMHLVLHAGATSRAIPSTWHPRSRIIKWNLLRAWQASDSTFLTSLSNVHDNIVTTMPSVAELLCLRIRQAGYEKRIRPLLILLSGEPVTQEILDRVAETFGCPVTSLYTTAEAGTIGRPCTLQGVFHAEEGNIVLEIIDEAGNPVAPWHEGTMAVTTLENYAMPLIRYRIGDRGYWLDGECDCGNLAPRFKLTTARRTSRLVSTSGATVNVVRFAKLLASLDINKYVFEQTADGAVLISYFADKQLDEASRNLLKAAVWAALGPETIIRIQYSLREGDIITSLNQQSLNFSHASAFMHEPDGPHLESIARWLRGALTDEGCIEHAVLTGSALNAETTSRFSDLDLVIFPKSDINDARWLTLAQRLRLHVPKLSINIDSLADLSRRAPLITCRLLKEQLPIIGCVDASVLPWPSLEELRMQGRFWAQEAEAILWHKLVQGKTAIIDPIGEAWFSVKYGLNALRYKYLTKGEMETSANAIITRSLQDEGISLWVTDLLEAFDVAREHKPPPQATFEAVARYTAAALFCVRSVRLEL